MQHFSCENSYLLRSINLILFTPLLVHFISNHQHSSLLSCPWPFTPDLKLKNILQILSSVAVQVPSGLPSQILDFDRTKISVHWRLFVLVSYFIHFLFLLTCAILSWPHSAVQSTINSQIMSFSMVLM